MKRVSLFGILSISLLVLGACGNETSDTSGDATKASVEEVISTSSSVEDESENVIEINQEVTNNDNFKATLLNVKHILDKEYDEEKYVLTFDIENKRKDTITVQARELSINDRMVDENILLMSTDISGGKVGTAELTIEDISGGELPEIKGNLEMLLHVFNEDIDAEEFNQDEHIVVDIK